MLPIITKGSRRQVGESIHTRLLITCPEPPNLSSEIINTDGQGIRLHAIFYLVKVMNVVPRHFRLSGPAEERMLEFMNDFNLFITRTRTIDQNLM